MRTGTKAKVQEIASDLYKNRVTREVTQVTTLLGLLFEEAKHNLVKCNPADFARLQGEAQALEGLIRMMTRPPAKLTPDEDR